MMSGKRIVVVSLAIMVIAGIMRICVASTSITVIDDLRRTVTITSSERIVCIGPSCTEIAYTLGLGDRVVGVDVYSDYPPEAVAKQKISDWWTPDPEEVAALNPDLVLYSVGYEPSVDLLENAGLTVIALNPKTIDDIFRDIKLVGNATGKSHEAEVLVSAMSQKIDEIKEKTSNVAEKPGVYIEFWYPPPWTFGPNTWGHKLIELAGGINVFGNAKAEWVQTTDEEVIARNPEVIISLCGAMHYATLEEMKKRPGWDAISAIANGRVYLLDENLIVRPAPRLVDGLEILAKILHPKLFGEAGLYTFFVNATMLKTETQTFTLTGPITADITVIKAADNCTLVVATSKFGPEAPANLKLIGNYLDVDSSVPAGLTFMFRIYYADDQLRTRGVGEDSLAIYMWNSEEERWVPLNCIVNKDENYVEAVVMRLGYFALMGGPEPVLWERSIPLWLSIVLLMVTAIITGVGVYIACQKRKSA